MRISLLESESRQSTVQSTRRWAGALLAVALAVTSWDGAQAQPTVKTLGGGAISAPYSGYVNGITLSQAKFAAPAGLAVDPSGTFLFIADYTNNAVRMASQVANSSAAGVTTSFATSTSGVSRPLAVVVDAATNVFVLNHGTTGANGTLQRFVGVTGVAGTATTLATGLANATALALDSVDNCYLTVGGNKVIRVATNGAQTTIGTISTTGTALQGITLLPNNCAALADGGNNGILIMNLTNGATTNLTGFHGAGDTLGGPTVAAFRSLEMISAAGGGMLVVADSGNDKVKLVDASGNVSLLYGVSSNLWLTGTGYWPGWADGPGSATQGSAESRKPYGVLVSSDGSVFVSEDYYHVLRHVTSTGLTPPPAPGSGASTGGGSGGSGSSPSFNSPAGIAFDSVGNFLFVANTANNTVQELNMNLSTNAVSTVLTAADGLTNPVAVTVDPDENLYVLNRGSGANGYVLEFDAYGNDYGAIVTGLNQPTALTLDGFGNVLITEQAGRIRAFGTGVSNTIAIITNANVSLQGIAIFDDGTIAVSDAGNAVIWTIDPITRVVTKLTGQLGTPGIAVGATNFAKLNQPRQLAHAGGNQIVAADYGNNRVVLVQRTGYLITNNVTYHLNASDALLYFGTSSDPVATNSTKFVPMVQPFGVAVGASGQVFDSEVAYDDIREMLGTSVSAPGTPPGLDFPVFSSLGGVALNSSNTLLYATDPVADTVSILDLANNQTTVYLDGGSGLYEPVDVALDVNDNLYVLNQGTGGNGSILCFDSFGYLVATNATGLAMPTAMKMDMSGNIYVAEKNGVVQRIAGTNFTVVADITTNASVQLAGIALLDNGSVVVSDAGNQVVWAIPAASTNAILLTGVVGSSGTNFGPVGYAKLNQPTRLAQVTGGELLIADTGNNRIVLANSLGTVSKALNSTNAELWFGVPTDPVTAGNANFVSMVSPVGLALGANGTVYDTETTYRDIRGILNTGLQGPAWPVAPVAPVIGWFDYEEDSLYEDVSVLHPITGIATFNNDPHLAIDSETNNYSVTTYYVAEPPPLTNTPSASTGTTPFAYQNGMAYGSVTPLDLPGLSDFIMAAVNVDAFGQASAVTTAEFRLQVGSPNIQGNNSAYFSVSDVTTNAQLYYTIDGTDPTNNGTGSSVGPLSLTGTNAVFLSIPVMTNTTFKIQGYRENYEPSGIAQEIFSPSNFVANTISFGFASGEASSAFVAAPGQTFFAPVTLTTLSGTVMYSLQFNLTVTNAGTNPGPAVAPGNYGFQSMLMKPDPTDPGFFLQIPTYCFESYLPTQTNPATVPYNGGYFDNLEFTNNQENLVGVGWLERMGETNLYNTKSQDLIAYSLAHDDLFPNANEPNEVILGGYSFAVPKTSTNGQTYQIQIGRPSATSDGVGAPGSAVYIDAPTSGNLAAGAPMNALKYVTVGQIAYVAGSAYPFNWFNAGDFGSAGIGAADVEQVFQSAIYGLNTPPSGSDFFDAMDSCGGTYVTNGNGYLQFGSYISGSNATNPLFNGNDTSINQIAFGDGVLDVCDVYVTFRRSLDPSLTCFERYWNNGQRVARVVPNVGYTGQPLTNQPNAVQAAILQAKTVQAATIQSKVTTAATVNPQVNFVAADATGSAGQVVQVPINATVFGNYPLRVLMLNLTVAPLDGSPDLAAPVQFTQTAALLGTPYMTDSQGNDNYSAVWLDSTNTGLTGTAMIGYLTLTIPANAGSQAAYAIHFDHASASPNGLASFPKQTLTGLVTLSSRTNSTYNDGIPDSWRLRYFGTIYNLLSVSNACPSGDGVDNWQKYEAGVDPNVANDFPSTHPLQPVPAGATTAIQWPSVANKQYVILRSPTLFNTPWTAIATNTGTGTQMEFDDTSTGNTLFYRVLILP